MAKITLYRHGKVDFGSKRWVYSASLRNEIVRYDQAIVALPDDKLPIITARVLITSALARSIASAEIWGRHDNVTDSLFNEAELPDLRMLPIKLPVRVWFIIARIAWRLGYARNCESYQEFTKRVEHAATQLDQIARAKGSVALIGHGIMNRALVQGLRARGYITTTRPMFKHWQAVELVSTSTSNGSSNKKRQPQCDRPSRSLG